MKELYSVLKKPLLTEKGAFLKESQNKILIEVAPEANKLEIKKAVEEIFKVKVEKVSTVRAQGKMRSYGRFRGRRPDRKKAIITLKKGEKLNFIEGM